MLVKDYSLSVPLKQKSISPPIYLRQCGVGGEQAEYGRTRTAHGGIDCSLVIELFFYFSDNGVLREDTRFEVID